MKLDEVFSRFFEFEFCEPNQKAERERDLDSILQLASQETGKPLYILKPAILKMYPQYRAKRLGKEMPELPFTVRDK